ncbi:hypothetical protein [Microbacterium sp. Y-01]|uniref:hypothetical protein n=1 Tax=Microbacterium sp. Y-01 TaxID=2048898 RepID=UPI0013DDD3D0|nr:hypothetical protein [Microbacterium sp. Y-01]
MFLILLFMRPAAAVYGWCQQWLPSNRIVWHLHTRRGLRWGIPTILLGGTYAVAGIGCYGAVLLGHTGWWYLGMVVCWWTALKLIGHGLYATIALPIARAHENLAVRRAIRDERRAHATQDDTPARRWTAQERRQITREVRREMLAG